MLESVTNPGAASDGFLPGPGVPGLVSVVIPTYNRAGLIESAIRSVLGQSYSNIEVIVADDGSTDSTREVVERYGAPVRYVYQPNAGVSAARNLGFRHARGEFVALLDSDDEWLPWKLEAQVRLLRAHPEVGMVWTDMTAVSDAGEVLHERYLRIFYDAHELARLEEVCESAEPVHSFWPEAPGEVAEAAVLKGDIFSRMLLGNLVHTSTVLVRRDRLRESGGVDTSFNPRGEDYEFHLRISSFGSVALLEAPAVTYRIGAPDQLTVPRMGLYSARANLVTVLRWLERGGNRVTLSERMVRDRLAQAYGWVGEVEMAYGEWSEARPNLWSSLRYRPAQRKTALLLAFSVLPRPFFRQALRASALLRAGVAWLRGRRVASTLVAVLDFRSGELRAVDFAVGLESLVALAAELTLSGLAPVG